MIDKKQAARERGRGFFLPKDDRIVYRKHNFFYPIYAALSFLLPFWLRKEVEPFTLDAAKYVPLKDSAPVRFSNIGYTSRRVKKVGNFFAYGWIKHDKRIGGAHVL